jgi:hypothetical protein
MPHVLLEDNESSGFFQLITVQMVGKQKLWQNFTADKSLAGCQTESLADFPADH